MKGEDHRMETEGIMLVIGEDGVARQYDDTYDVTIHCESREEHDRIMKILENGLKSEADRISVLNEGHADEGENTPAAGENPAETSGKEAP